MQLIFVFNLSICSFIFCIPLLIIFIFFNPVYIPRLIKSMAKQTVKTISIANIMYGIISHELAKFIKLNFAKSYLLSVHYRV